jgi:hypothetical protein
MVRPVIDDNDRTRGAAPSVRGGFAAGLLLLMAVACSGDDEANPVSGQEGSDAESAESTSAADAEGARSGEEDGQAGASEPLAHVSGELPDFSETQMVPLGLDVTSLRRNGELVELEMTLTVEVENPPSDFRFNIWSYLTDNVDTGSTNFDVSGVRIIDQEGRYAYLPAVDSQGVCLCSSAGSDIAPGESVDLQATFGGVPTDVSRVDVHVPGFSTAEHLTIEG